MLGRSSAFGVALVSLSLLGSGAAQATDFGAPPAASTHWGSTTVTVGGGVQNLFLPDVNFIELTNPAGTTIRKLETNDIDGELGYAINGEIEVPTSLFGANSWALRGFYGGINHESNRSCRGNASQACATTPIVDDGTAKVITGAGVSLNTNSERDVTNWGVALEGKRHLGGSRNFWALGGDIRGIDQDLDVVSSFTGTGGTANYNEDLDTTYYGVYLAYGSDYNLPFFRGVTSGLGLQSSFRLWGGLYYADTDYSGRYTRNIAGAGANQSLSLSDDDAAFIGGVTLETRKPIGLRTALKLRTDYEYYSYVPEMRYNETVGGAGGSVTGTTITDDDAFSIRTTLNLTIGLGPDQLYQQPY